MNVSRRSLLAGFLALPVVARFRRPPPPSVLSDVTSWAMPGGGTFFVALHTSDPSVPGLPETSYATYTDYARSTVTATEEWSAVKWMR